jgi:hypothetical protein
MLVHENGADGVVFFAMMVVCATCRYGLYLLFFSLSNHPVVLYRNMHILRRKLRCDTAYFKPCKVVIPSQLCDLELNVDVLPQWTLYIQLLILYLQLGLANENTMGAFSSVWPLPA